MRRRNSESNKRIKLIEKHLGKNGAGSDLFQRAMAEVLQEATDEELRAAAGSGKNGRCPTPGEMAAMHELFRNRAEQKIKKSNDEKGKQL